MDTNEVLHLGRTRYLARMPKVKESLLSAGCSGTWYFNWVRDNYGAVERHLGVEFYSPEPSDLPEGVHWIANTVSNMEGVPSGSVELVFSGQNIEHLWPEDVIGFLLESHRVLQPSGHLVIDSPNRLLAEELKWSHPEHTVELTAGEMIDLLRMAGFEPDVTRAIWRCRDGETGALMPLELSGEDDERELEARLERPGEEVDDCLIWWIEARKTGRDPDEQALRKKMASIYEKAWPKRWKRSIVPDDPQLRVVQNGDRQVIKASKAYNGPIAFGPYIPLHPGRYRVTLNLSAGFGLTGDGIARCDVIDADLDELVVKHLDRGDLARCGGRVTMEFELDRLHFGIQVRCFSFGKSALTLTLPLEYEEEPASVG